MQINKGWSEVDSIQEAASMLRKSKKLLVLTGAGISAESGIQTYRGPSGLYREEEAPDAILSLDTWQKHPLQLWTYIDKVRQKMATAQPNPAHDSLVAWERSSRFTAFLVATQNIDGLHRQAGQTHLSEMHGSIWRMRKSSAKTNETDSANILWENRDTPFPRLPPTDDPTVRPDVLLFGETYGNRLARVESFLKQKPDTVVGIGCSHGVGLTAHLVNEARKHDQDCAIIVINPYIDSLTGPRLYLRMSASTALVQLTTALGCC